MTRSIAHCLQFFTIMLLTFIKIPEKETKHKQMRTFLLVYSDCLLICCLHCCVRNLLNYFSSPYFLLKVVILSRTHCRKYIHVAFVVLFSFHFDCKTHLICLNSILCGSIVCVRNGIMLILNNSHRFK